MTNLLKTAQYFLTITLLAANIALIGMENNNFMTAHIKFNEIMARPFEHEKSEPRITLSPKSIIGYGDAACIETLTNTNISAHPHSPLVSVETVRPRDIIEIAKKQMLSEKEETIQLFRENPPTNRVEKPIFLDNIERFNARAKKITACALEYKNAIYSANSMPLIPIEHLLTSNHITLNNVPFKFTEHKKLEELLTNFEQQPTTLFFTIEQSTADKLYYINERHITDNHYIAAIQQELYNQIESKKQDLRTKGIIQRRNPQYDDFQDYVDQTLFPLTVIQHISNYHNHGENGYSNEKIRKTILENKLGKKRTLEFINNRAAGAKYRKITKDTHLTIDNSDNSKS